MAGLEELGWLQFERLCELVLEADAGVPPSAWEGSADSARRYVSTAPLRIGGLTLAPPVLVRCVWMRQESALRRRAEFPSNVTFANVPAEGDVVYGERELLDAIARLPDLRLRLPSVLSLDAAPPDPDALGRSTLDVEAARALARVFVATPAWHQALTALRGHHFAVISGPPEMGKTAIARVLGLALLTQGWEAHECTRPEQVFARLDPARPQLFVADDAFGSNEYRADAAERWAADLDRILRAMDATHWLVWTSRPTPLRAGLRRLGRDRFPHVHVDAAALGPEEKTLILYRHARAANRSRSFIGARGREIVEHPHFTPERIRRYVADGDVERALTRPTEAMAASFAALEPEQRELLRALLDCPPGPVAERDLAESLRRHAAGGLSHSPVDLVDLLTDHFVRVL